MRQLERIDKDIGLIVLPVSHVGQRLRREGLLVWRLVRQLCCTAHADVGVGEELLVASET